LEEICVALVSYRRVDVLRNSLPVFNQLRITTSHRWFRRRIEAPEFRTLVEVNLAVPGPHGGRVDVIGDAGEPVADFLRIITIHSGVDIPPVLRALKDEVSSKQNLLLINMKNQFFLLLTLDRINNHLEKVSFAVPVCKCGIDVRRKLLPRTTNTSRIATSHTIVR